MPQRDVPEFFAFYPYEFLGDENVLAMTLEQVGAYLLLMCGQWFNGSIPSDIPTLARLLKRNTGEMEILWAGIAPCFRPHPDQAGRLIQPRLEAERAKSLDAMATERARVKAYRDRKKAAQRAEGVAVPEERTGTDAVRNDDVTVPSTLLYSPLNTSTEKKEFRRDATPEECAAFRKMYPSHRLDDYGFQCFMTVENPADILARLRLAVKSDDWKRDGGRYVPKASKWIMDGAPAPEGAKPEKTKYFDPRKITG